MAFCRNCGAQLPEGGKFCIKCGAPVPSGNEQTTPQVDYGAVAKPELSPEEKKKKNKKIITIAVIVVVAAAVITAAIIVVKNILEKQATKRKTIDLSEFITVEFEGYDTMGTANVEIDEDKFIDKALYAMKASEDNDKAVNKAQELYDSIYVYADVMNSLSNGDNVEIGADWSKDAVRKAGVILKFKKYEVDVEGLDEIKVIDPFEFADVQFSGVDGDVSVNVENTSTDKALSLISFYPDSYYGLSKGDTVTVSASYNSYTLLNDYGIKIEPEEKTYTVDNVDTYDVESADISQDFIDSLLETSLEEINDIYSYSSYKVSDVDYTGFYLLKAKEERKSPQNAILIVYKGTATGSDKTKEVFFPVEYDGVIKKTDGTLYLESDYASLWGYSGGIYGYISEKEMFDDIAFDNSEDYDIFISDGLRDYSEMNAKEDGSNVVAIPWNYHYSDAVDELIEHGVFENLDQFNIEDYVSSDNIDDDEDFIELVNLILRTLSKDETAHMDAVGPIPVDKSVTWFYFDEDNSDYRLIFGTADNKTSDGKETDAADQTETAGETTVADETTEEETTAAK